MLRIVLCGGLIGSLSIAALFAPISPAILQSMGYYDGTPTPVNSAKQDVEVAPKRISLVAPGNAKSNQPHLNNHDMRADLVRRLTFAPSSVTWVPSSGRDVPRVSISSVRELQSELRRVGCYNGRIDGDWGPASRYAMALFTKAVNAALPTHRPDIVLLSLVRRYRGQACQIRRSDRIEMAHTSVPSVSVTSQSPNNGLNIASLRAGQTAEPSLIKAPRIVRQDGTMLSSGSRIVIQRSSHPTNVQTLRRASAELQAFSSGSRMSLGVAPPIIREPQLVLREPSISDSRARRRYDRIRPSKRADRAKRRWRSSGRSRSKRWSRSVHQGVNLNGS